MKHIASILFVVLLAGCGLFGGANAPNDRAIARGAVVATAEAVRLADEACAKYGAATRDAELLATCAKHYDVARVALIGTASAVDLWERADHQSVTCSLLEALAQVEQLDQELAKKGGRIPPAVSDARALVSVLGGCSRG